MATKASNKSLRPTMWRRFLVGSGIVVLVLLGLLVTFKHISHTISTAQNGDSTSDQANQDSQKKAAVIDNGGNPVNTNTRNESAAPTQPYAPPTSNSGISMSASQSNNQVTVSTQLAGYSDGTCTLSVTNGNKSTTQTAEVIYAPDFSTCAGFSVPKGELGSGTWNIQLDVLSGGVTNSKTITYEVQ